MKHLCATDLCDQRGEQHHEKEHPRRRHVIQTDQALRHVRCQPRDLFFYFYLFYLFIYYFILLFGRAAALVRQLSTCEVEEVVGW